MSLETGYFPDPLKHAHISPLLKNPKLDPEELNDCRPIAYLKLLGKTIERLAVIQIQDHLSYNHLHAATQSAYRKNHSCETALLRVHNDLLLALDKGQEAILILLDYSAAFDTISHNSLIHRLQDRFGICGSVLNWVKSYLINRSQSVIGKN